MIRLAPALLLAAAAHATAPQATVSKVMSRVDALAAKEPGHDARFIDGLDKKAEALFAEIKPLGWRAAAPLGDAAKDLKRPEKSRLFAVTFLSKLNDPSAFPPLSAVFLDPAQGEDVRLAAAQGLIALDVPPQAARRTFCALFAEQDPPRTVLTEGLIAAARLGCDDSAPLTRAARAFGPRPSGADMNDARRALTALGRSRGAAPARALLGLIVWFPSGGDARAAAVKALGEHRDDLATSLKREAFPAIRDALRTESGRPESMVVLVNLMDAFGPEADEFLVPLSSHPDPEVLAVAAEALARRRAVQALPQLETVLAGALSDPRFAPKPGRPDPAELLSRLEAAVVSLRRDRAAAR
ncbi:MAG: hypothetical protein ACHQ51_12110 [Elusimicrobiota bacterium]